VITYFGGDDIPIFLLGALSKGERENLSKAEKNELKKELAGIVSEYRARVKAKVTHLAKGRKR
jgi:hypothetical protein